VHFVCKKDLEYAFATKSGGFPMTTISAGLSFSQKLSLLYEQRIFAEKPPITGEKRRAVIWRDGKRCALCQITRNLTIHHILPRQDGGGDEMDNLITLCSKCHDLVEDMLNERPELKTREGLLRLRYEQPAGKQIIGLKDGPPETTKYRPLWVGEGRTAQEIKERTKSFVAVYRALGRWDEHIAILSKHTNRVNTIATLTMLFPGGKSWNDIFCDHNSKEGRNG
jgi:hypothetical protein